MVPFFSQELECLIVSFNVSFRSCLLESPLVILTFGQDMTSTYILSLKPLSEEISSLTQHFLFFRRGIMEPTLCVLVNCSPAWSCPQVFRSGLRMRLGEGRFGLWQGVVFLQSFWNFKAIPDTEIILTSIQSKLILKKFKWFLWRVFFRCDENFCFDFGENVKNTKWHRVGHKRFKFQFEG